MGQGASREEAVAPNKFLKFGRLTRPHLDMLMERLHIRREDQSVEIIAQTPVAFPDFCELFPPVIRPFVALLLPSLRDIIAEDTQPKPCPKGPESESLVRKGTRWFTSGVEKEGSTTRAGIQRKKTTRNVASAGGVLGATNSMTFQEAVSAVNALIRPSRKYLQNICTAFSARATDGSLTEVTHACELLLCFIYVQSLWSIDPELVLFRSPITTESSNSPPPEKNSPPMTDRTGRLSPTDAQGVRRNSSVHSSAECASDVTSRRRSSRTLTMHSNQAPMSTIAVPSRRREGRSMSVGPMSSQDKVPDARPRERSVAPTVTFEKEVPKDSRFKRPFRSYLKGTDDGTYQRINSWDISGVYLPKKYSGVRTGPKRQEALAFEYLLESFNRFCVENEPTMLQGTYAVLFAWADVTFPNFGDVCRGSFRTQLFGEGFNDEPTSMVIPSVADLVDSDVEIPPLERSASTKSIIRDFRGWRGVWSYQSSDILADEIFCALRLSVRSNYSGPWTRLFASWCGGSSFQRLVANLTEYDEPTIIVVRTTNNFVFGGCNTEAWKENGSRFFGSSSCFLFEVSPRYRVYRGTHLGKNYVYLNSKNRSSPKGLGFGGKAECFRLWIAEDLIDGHVTTADRSFANGKLLEELSDEDGFQKKFKVRDVELWGCGDAATLARQRQRLKMNEQVKLERRKVDKSRLVENEFDREYILGGKFAKGGSRMEAAST